MQEWCTGNGAVIYDSWSSSRGNCHSGSGAVPLNRNAGISCLDHCAESLRCRAVGISSPNARGDRRIASTAPVPPVIPSAGHFLPVEGRLAEGMPFAADAEGGPPEVVGVSGDSWGTLKSSFRKPQ